MAALDRNGGKVHDEVQGRGHRKTTSMKLGGWHGPFKTK